MRVAAIGWAFDDLDAVRNAVSLGGDADTLACIAGAMAEAYDGRVPGAIQAEVMTRLDPVLRAEVAAFAQRYGVPRRAGHRPKLARMAIQRRLMSALLLRSTTAGAKT